MVLALELLAIHFRMLPRFFPTNLAIFLIDYKSFLSSQNWNVNVDGNNFDLERDVINDIASH